MATWISVTSTPELYSSVYTRSGWLTNKTRCPPTPILSVTKFLALIRKTWKTPSTLWACTMIAHFDFHLDWSENLEWEPLILSNWREMPVRVVPKEKVISELEAGLIHWWINPKSKSRFNCGKWGIPGGLPVTAVMWAASLFPAHHDVNYSATTSSSPDGPKTFPLSCFLKYLITAASLKHYPTLSTM